MKGNFKKYLLSFNDSYTEDTRDFINYLETSGNVFSLEGLKAYEQHLKNSSYSANTINKRLFGAKKRIRQLFKKMPESFDILKVYKLEQELKEIKGEKIQNKIIEKDKILSLKEIDTLKENAPLFLNLMIEFLIHTGLRISEMLLIKQLKIQQESNYVIITVKGKGRIERKIKVKTDLINRIQKFFNGKIFLFESAEGLSYSRGQITLRIKRLGRKVLNKNISANTFRHTFATLMIKKTGKIKGVSQYLGHSSTSITLDMYCHESLGIEELLL